MLLTLDQILDSIYNDYKDFFKDNQKRLMFATEVRRIVGLMESGELSEEEGTQQIKDLLTLFFGDLMTDDVKDTIATRIILYVKYKKRFFEARRGRRGLFA